MLGLEKLLNVFQMPAISTCQLNGIPWHQPPLLSSILSEPGNECSRPPPKTREPERVSCTENRKPTFMIREKASDGSLVLLKNLEALTSSTHPQIRDAFQLCN